MTLTLTFVGRYTTKKDGTPLISAKNGRPYTSIRVKANEYGDRWISGFDSKETAGWKAGDTVEANVEEKGEYLNLSVPKSNDAPAMSEALEAKLGYISRNVDAILQILQSKPWEVKGTPTPQGATIGTQQYPTGSNTTAFDDDLEGMFDHA